MTVTFSRLTGLIGILALTSLPTFGQTVTRAAFSLEAGEAVATCFSGYENNSPTQGIALDEPVVAVVDVRSPTAQGAVPGEHWLAPKYHNERAASSTGNPGDQWTARNLGQVFGIALDGDPKPNIFVTASSTYFPVFNPDGSFADGNFGDLGSGGVYRLDGLTGAICPHARLHEVMLPPDPMHPNGRKVPGVGPALGNIAYDSAHDQLFVSSFEDGFIYRLPARSPCGVPVQPTDIDTYDHGMDGRPAEGLSQIRDNGALYVPSPGAYQVRRSCTRVPQSGFTPLGRRVWGVQVYEGRLYYSVWNEDGGPRRHTATVANEIWSIGLLPGGGFDRLDIRRELEIEPLPMTEYSNPVSDIAFSADGRMLLAERVRCRDHGVEGSNAHEARVLEYERGPTGSFNQKLRGVPIGFHHTHRNAAGGVDYGYDTAEGAVCDATVWATGDALRLREPTSPTAVYGLQGTPDGAPAMDRATLEASFFVDLDEEFTGSDKTEIGDVEVARADCLDPPCLQNLTFETLCAVDDGSATGDFTWRFRIRNESGAPIHHLFLNDLPAGVSADPAHLVFDPPIPNNGFSRPQTVTLTGASAGTSLELVVSIHDALLAECCSETVTVELPDCECAQIVAEQRPACYLPPFTLPPPFRYRVELQNLSDRSAQYLLAAPVSPADLMTPISPDDLKVTGSRSLGQPVAPGGTTGSVQFSITGPGAVPGREVCLYLNLSDAGFRSCCSFPRCFELPDCRLDPGDFTDPPRPFEGTVLNFEGGDLVLSGYGEGVGGLDLSLVGADVFVVGLRPIGPAAGSDGDIRIVASSVDDRELVTVRAQETGGEIAVSGGFGSPPGRVVIELLDADGSVIRSETGAGGRPAVYLESWPAGFVSDAGGGKITIVGHEDSYLVRLRDGSREEVSAVRLRAVGGSDGRIGAVDLRVEGLEELRLRTLLAFDDCDGDGVPDGDAIAQERVEDVNGDGVPDACEGEPPSP